MVPVLMPILGCPLESSYMSCRAPDVVHCQQSWASQLSRLSTWHPELGQKQPCSSQELPWQLPPRQGAQGRGVRKPAAMFFQNILLPSNSLQRDSLASALFLSSK